MSLGSLIWIGIFAFMAVEVVLSVLLGMRLRKVQKSQESWDELNRMAHELRTKAQVLYENAEQAAAVTKIFQEYKVCSTCQTIVSQYVIDENGQTLCVKCLHPVFGD